MPILANAKKALRRDRRHTKFNQNTKLKLKTAIRTLRDSGDPDTLPAAYSAIDRAVKKHLMHKNKAARLKSQLVKHLKTPAKSAASTTKKAKPKKASPQKTASKRSKPTPKSAKKKS